MAAAGQNGHLSLLGRDMALYGILSGIARMGGLMALPFLTRGLAPKDYGVVELMLSSVTVLSLIFSLSLESALARLWSDVESAQERRDLIFSVVAAAGGAGLSLSLLGLGAATVAAAIGKLGMALSDILIVLASATMLAAGGILSTAFRMERKILPYNGFFFLTSLSFLVLSYTTLYAFHWGRAGVTFAILSSNALGFGYVVFLRRDAFHGQLRLHLVRSALHISLPILPAVILSWVARQFDKLILASLVGLNAVALYGAAEKLSFTVSFSVSVFQQAWLPFALGKFDDSATRDAFFAKVLLLYATGTIGLASILFCFSHEVWALVVPPAYAGGLSLLPWIVGSAIAYAAGSISGIGLVLAKRTGGNFIASAIACTLNIVGSSALVGVIGIGGAGVSAFVAAMIYASILGFYSFRTTRLRFPFGRLAIMVAMYVMAAIVIFGLPGRSASDLPPLAVRALVSASLAVGVIVTGLGFRGLNQSVRQVLAIRK